MSPPSDGTASSLDDGFSLDTWLGEDEPPDEAESESGETEARTGLLGVPAALRGIEFGGVFDRGSTSDEPVGDETEAESGGWFLGVREFLGGRAPFDGLRGDEETDQETAEEPFVFPPDTGDGTERKVGLADIPDGSLEEAYSVFEERPSHESTAEADEAAEPVPDVPEPTEGAETDRVGIAGIAATITQFLPGGAAAEQSSAHEAGFSLDDWAAEAGPLDPGRLEAATQQRPLPARIGAFLPDRSALERGRAAGASAARTVQGWATIAVTGILGAVAGGYAIVTERLSGAMDRTRTADSPENAFNLDEWAAEAGPLDPGRLEAATQQRPLPARAVAVIRDGTHLERVRAAGASAARTVQRWTIAAVTAARAAVASGYAAVTVLMSQAMDRAQPADSRESAFSVDEWVAGAGPVDPARIEAASESRSALATVSGLIGGFTLSDWLRRGEGPVDPFQTPPEGTGGGGAGAGESASISHRLSEVSIPPRETIDRIRASPTILLAIVGVVIVAGVGAGAFALDGAGLFGTGGGTDASLSFVAQSSDGSTVTVESATLPNGGFVVIHNDTYVAKGDGSDSVIGVSNYLEAGTHEDVEITLFEVPGGVSSRSKLQQSATLIAIPHQDTNGNQQFDYAAEDGGADTPYTTDGVAVFTQAAVDVDTPTPTATPSPTPTPTATPTPSPSPTPTASPTPSPTPTPTASPTPTATPSPTPTERQTEPDDGGPLPLSTAGFGPSGGLVIPISIVALLALAHRRD